MSQSQHHPELHVNEEPRNDAMDVGFGFGAMFAVCALIFIIAVAIKLAM